MKVFIGCCLIHLCIGSIYAWSVLYPNVINSTGWDETILIAGFSLTILALGLTASFHQRVFNGFKRVNLLLLGLLIWVISNACLSLNLTSLNSAIIHIIVSTVLGVGIGLLYVIPINIITAYGKTSVATGLVVFNFGLGSIIAAKLFSGIVDMSSLLWGVLVYGMLMCMGVCLIFIGLKSSLILIEYNNTFKRDRDWYVLATIFFFNIGIGISLLSNLTQLSLDRDYTIEGAVFLVALAGLANTFGRFIYPLLSDKYEQLDILGLMLDIQAVALVLIIVSDSLWGISTVLIISIYGGLFALMPILCKNKYKDSNAYSQILSMWGFSGLICPLVFSCLGVPSLLIMSSILLIAFCNLSKIKGTKG